MRSAENPQMPFGKQLVPTGETGSMGGRRRPQRPEGQVESRDGEEGFGAEDRQLVRIKESTEEQAREATLKK